MPRRAAVFCVFSAAPASAAPLSGEPPARAERFFYVFRVFRKFMKRPRSFRKWLCQMGIRKMMKRGSRTPDV
jgi:hypothetical protein